MPLVSEDRSPPIAVGILPPVELDGVIFDLLREQQKLTAVETFSRWHEQSPAMASHYKALLPTAPLAVGEQFAFEVDLDACSGCKACVTACHAMNGLDEGETWRSVGALVDTSCELPMVQHVTTACHHCVDPGCLAGCPVMAYDKDPITGIVRHLDDQCIGCQYCVLMCPYEVPRYSAKRGIVRKCDMCRQRLAVDEAPACVQGCPNQAIRITKVATAVARDRSVVALLPQTVESTLTTPTTVFKSRRADLASVRWQAGDMGHVRPAHAHWPLVFMLVFTQASVGLLAWWLWSGWKTGESEILRLAVLTLSVLLGLAGGAAASLHLGNPWGAWRVFLGLRTSWLSREAIAFGLYGPLGGILLTSELMDMGLSPLLRAAIAFTTLLVGVIGVICSIFIYAVTGRPFWSPPRVSIRFVLTSLATTVAVLLFTGVLLGVSSIAMPLLAATLAIVSSFVMLEPLWSKDTRLARTKTLLTGPLAGRLRAQLALNIVAGIAAIALLFVEPVPVLACTVGCAMLLTRFAAEVVERRIFFEAGVSQGMPGAQA